MAEVPKASFVPEGSVGVRRVSSGCCVVGDSLFVFGGYMYDELYERPRLSNDVSTWTVEYGWRHHRLPSDRIAPSARAGHTCCEREGNVLVYGGHNEAGQKLADLWELRTSGSSTHYNVVLLLDAVLTAEDAEAEAERRLKASKGKSKDDEPPPIAVFDADTLRTNLQATLKLPAEAIRIAEPTAVGDPAPAKGKAEEETGVSVVVEIEPMYAVGLSTYGVDGDALPQAALYAFRDQLQAAGVRSAAAEAAADAKGGAKAADKKKGGAVKGAADGESEQVVPQPATGYHIHSWRLNETLEELPGVLSWRQWLPTDESKMVAPRSGHTATVAGGFMWLFGGALSSGALSADLSALELSSTEWVPVEITGKPPRARAFHSACAVPLVSGEATEEALLVCGGFDGKVRLDDCVIFHVPKRQWSAVEVAPAPGSLLPACWHTAEAFADGRVLLFGGTGEADAPLDRVAMLELSAQEEGGATKHRAALSALDIGASDAGPRPAARHGHCMALLPPGMARDGVAGVLIFGGMAADRLLDDCWQLELTVTVSVNDTE